MKFIKNIWTGVFIKKPRIKGDYFKDKNWHDKSKLRIKKLKKNNPPLCDNITPGFISALDKELKILDFGGGYGNLYYIFNRSIKKKFSITVYDNSLTTIKNAKLLSPKNSKINYSTDLDQIKKKKFDLIYFGSVFQYIFNFGEINQLIKKTNPKYLIFYDLMAGNNPNFYSYQNYYGKKMLVKFYNYNFFKKNFKKIGFRVIYENKMFTQLFGRLTELPMHNFNKKFRVNYSKFLIMKK